MINIDRGIGLGLGAGLTLLSFSGLKCINSIPTKNVCAMPASCGLNNTGCPPNIECPPRSNGCSKTNMNLGLGSLMVSGILITYKHLRN